MAEPHMRVVSVSVSVCISGCRRENLSVIIRMCLEQNDTRTKRRRRLTSKVISVRKIKFRLVNFCLGRRHRDTDRRRVRTHRECMHIQYNNVHACTCSLYVHTTDAVFAFGCEDLLNLFFGYHRRRRCHVIRRVSSRRISCA